MHRDQDIKHIKRLVKQVNRLLSEQWDPIGMRDEDPKIAYTEYESYAPKIAGMIFNGADASALADHLAQIRSMEMGLGGESKTDREVAEMLVSLLDR